MSGRLAFTIDFTAKAVDMNIDDVGIGVDAHAPNFIENHGAGDDATWIAAEIFKQGELLRRETEGLTVAKSLAAKQVHLKIEDAEPSGFGGQDDARGESAQASEELSEGEGFSEVVVASLLQATDAVVNGAASGEDEHGSVDAELSEPED